MEEKYVPVSGNGLIGWAWTGLSQDMVGNHARAMARAKQARSGPGEDESEEDGEE